MILFIQSYQNTAVAERLEDVWILPKMFVSGRVSHSPHPPPLPNLRWHGPVQVLF